MKACLWLAALVAVSALWSAAPADAALDRVLQGETQEERGGFGAVLFTDRGEVWSRAGTPGGRIPFGRDTPLMVGELSGQFIILAAAQLAAQGRLDFERPLGAYLPELARGPGHLPELARLKVGLLAAEATGRVDSIPMLRPGYRPGRDLLPALAERSNRFPPGFRRSGSCGMTDLLALVLERCGRRPWRRMVADAALRPLGMDASAFVAPAAAMARVPFHFPDGARCDPRLLDSLLPPLAPSLSLRSSLPDLAAGGSALLAAWAGRPGALSPQAARSVLAPAIPGQLDRQGFASGLGWTLTDYRLAYLGRVAWAYGACVTHQTLVMLLPDLGLGVALGETWHDPSGLFDLKRMARGLLQTYAERALGIPRPEFRVPSVIPPIPEAERPLPGLYAAPEGVAEVELDGDLVRVSARGAYGEFWREGPGRFAPASESEFAGLDCEPGRITLAWRSGARMALERVAPGAPSPPLEPGAFLVEARGSVQRRGAALIARRGAQWTITDDDGMAYLLLPDPPGGFRVLCSQASALYGCEVTVDAGGATHVRAP